MACFTAVIAMARRCWAVAPCGSQFPQPPRPAGGWRFRVCFHRDRLHAMLPQRPLSSCGTCVMKKSLGSCRSAQRRPQSARPRQIAQKDHGQRRGGVHVEPRPGERQGASPSRASSSSGGSSASGRHGDYLHSSCCHLLQHVWPRSQPGRGGVLPPGSLGAPAPLQQRTAPPSLTLAANACTNACSKSLRASTAWRGAQASSTRCASRP